MTSTLDDARGELLACPFCGQQPEYRFVPNPNGPKYPDHHEIWCENLDCSGGGPSEITKEDAVKAWNTRAAPVPRCGAESANPLGYWQMMYYDLLKRVDAGEFAVSPPSEAGRDKAMAAFRQNLQEAWAAMAMIRETIETLGPVGAVKASEHLDGPTFMHEAEALVAGIVALSPDQGTVARSPDHPGSDTPSGHPSAENDATLTVTQPFAWTLPGDDAADCNGFIPCRVSQDGEFSKALYDRANGITEDQIKHMVDRFLCWKLPEHFNPDGGISFKRTFNEHTAHPMKHEPIGTNLFDATQADAMVRYMIEGVESDTP